MNNFEFAYVIFCLHKEKEFYSAKLIKLMLHKLINQRFEAILNFDRLQFVSTICET